MLRTAPRKPSMFRVRIAAIAACLLLLGMLSPACADWPMWRQNAARTGTGSETLPTRLQLQWKRQFKRPAPAWPAEQGKVQFDATYQPISVGDCVYVPSMTEDSVNCYDLGTGQWKWTFFAEGPVRFAPVAAGEALLFVSDDGYLYCLNRHTGNLRWKFRGGPYDRWLLGNDRLISTWPARGAPVVDKQTVYFAAGIWPFMGIFIHAVDLETGTRKWTNSGSGSEYIVQQHNSPAFAGVAPQGYLALQGNTLLVSGGMTVPAAYDARTGEFLYFRPGERQLGKNAGGYQVVCGNDWYLNRGGLYDLATGEPLRHEPSNLVTEHELFTLESAELVVRSAELTRQTVKEKDRRGRVQTKQQATFANRTRLALPPSVKDMADQRLLLVSCNSIVTSDGDRTFRVLQLDDARTSLTESFAGQLDAELGAAICNGSYLLLVDRAGCLYCYGADTPNTHQLWQGSGAAGGDVSGTRAPRKSTTQTDKKTASRLSADVATLLQVWRDTPEPHFGMAYGLTSRQVLELAPTLAEHPSASWIAFIEDESTPAARRTLYSEWGAARIHLLPAGRSSDPVAPYLARWVYWNASQAKLNADASLTQALQAVRPYGGRFLFAASEPVPEILERARQLWEIEVTPHAVADGLFEIVRQGSLPGAGHWTHHNADIGNTLVSSERRVTLPLGLLWFGGPSNQDVLPRHGHGPTPQVLDGRLVIEGPNMLRAVDVYTGQLLWQRELPEIGLYYDNTGHHPGANAIGGNYVVHRDGVYVAYGRRCLQLDLATGETRAEFHLPPDPRSEQPIWGYLGVMGDYLIATSSPMLPYSRSKAQDPEQAIYTRFGEGSKRLVVLDRRTGTPLWHREAEFNFRHNALVCSDELIFCLDRMTPARRDFLKRRGQPIPAGQERLLALQLATGEVVWEDSQRVFGTWLGYRADKNVLIQGGSLFRDRARDEAGQGMAAYRATTGKLLWQHDRAYSGPPLLHPRWIITQGSAYDWSSGLPVVVESPLTGEQQPWKFTRNYGCNTAIGCANLLTFRSAAAGYFDLEGNGGTGNFGGFRTSCTSNLIPADGVLSAPDYTRTCTCSYQNQCSLALVPMQDVEVWTFHPWIWKGSPIQKLGLNFGAPGDRRTESALWLDIPSEGGVSANVPVTLHGSQRRYLRQHTNVMRGGELPWVGASAVEGLEKLEIPLSRSPTRPSEYRVSFVFAELDGTGRARRFDVILNGETVLRNVNIVQAAGGPFRTWLFTAKVQVDAQITIELRPTPDSDLPPLLNGLKLVKVENASE